MPDKDFLPPPPVSVAITGTLSIPRKEAARLINASKNAQFVNSVTFHTSYLVSALADSQKVKKALKIGVEILTEDQLFAYLSSGVFPPAKAHEYHQPAPIPFEVEWTTKYSEARHVLIRYEDAYNSYSEREADLFAIGHSHSGVTYLSVLDDEGFKTFRADRIIEMKEL